MFIAGGIVLSIFLTINYYFKILNLKKFGLTTIIVALITYCLAPLLFTQPIWLVLLIVVTVLAFTELKESFSLISKQLDKHEIITLAKFLAIAGVVLPIVPDTPFIPSIPVSPYKIWLAVVVISSISYFSYLLKKFVFKKSGVIISGILGGLYSSTAATIIMSKKSKEYPDATNQYASSIIFATAMMYIRILIIIFIFNKQSFITVYPYLVILTLTSVLTGIFILFYKHKEQYVQTEIYNDKNPLEFRVALIFTSLYVIFSFLTYYTISNYGVKGLNFLSFLVGFTDIDPFLINLFSGKFSVSLTAIGFAAFTAIISNNILKFIYSLTFSGRSIWKLVSIGFSIIIFVNVIMLFFLK